MFGERFGVKPGAYILFYEVGTDLHFEGEEELRFCVLVKSECL